MFSSYGYLGLNGHPRVDAAAQAAVARYGTTPGGVRLLTGTLQLHQELETELARFLGTGSASTYASGYDANLAAIASLFGPRDHVLLDQYAHRSLADAAVLSGARTERFRHNDLARLEARLADLTSEGPARILVVVDGVYSMEGDLAPLPELVALKQRYGAFLLLDESHAFGAIGATGRGTCEATGVDPRDVDLITGSLAKAVPSSGGFVAGSAALQVFLQHGSAPYVFSGALSPANSAAILETLRVVDDEPGHLRRLHENTGRLVRLLTDLGLDLPPGSGSSPVVPLLLGDSRRTQQWAAWLLEFGIATSAVLHPAVPHGRGRLRLCATAAHTEADFALLEAGLRACLAREALA
nr:pyridoxal phosphate-dependent aminotransferase family protein [Kineococcus siccus]